MDPETKKLVVALYNKEWRQKWKLAGNLADEFQAYLAEIAERAKKSSAIELKLEVS